MLVRDNLMNNCLFSKETYFMHWLHNGVRSTASCHRIFYGIYKLGQKQWEWRRRDRHKGCCDVRFIIGPGMGGGGGGRLERDPT